MKNSTETIRANRNLTFSEMEQAAEELFREETETAEIIEFLKALAQKGETASEVAALASVMNRHAIRPDLPGTPCFDNCGTGGDGSGSFNISTASAFVLAAAGVRVAKHGNRKVSSRAGSFDVLEALGIPNDLSIAETEGMMEETGMAFLFAQAYHPKLKRIGEIRRQIGSPTVFNLVGPLANPTTLSSQYTGISRKEFVMDYAAVLSMAGRERAVVVCGAGGLDEASLAGRNTLVLADRGDLIPFSLTPEDAGLARAGLEEVKGGDAAENAGIIRSVLEGKQGPKLDIVLLNAGIGLFAQGAVPTVREGVEAARECISSGKAAQQLSDVIAYCRQVGRKAVG
ncbi:anthranilate phosphoribosyltransferase [Sporosarcina trichiuri]|uniref:anthranilate phosphoribosyltransferase n=1 Tax=Sporosarcina trichiuri TaxID=3056445 RepID=UPI0025B42AC3|nr:anthranilate phosphoribosyltransferase [Sporosarcina sp. 0.2-SM1T-5]WJY26939.1 anthranilate phosphoribosyltransferase [Sporosarcina sp. 0.2-SM1T-5]